MAEEYRVTHLIDTVRSTLENSMLKRVMMVIVPLCGACYSYTPIRPAEAVPGSSVRAHVSQETSIRVAPLLGIPDVRDLTGKLIDNTAGTMIIEVPTVVQAGENNAVQTLFQRVTVRPGDLLGLESRTLNRTRTGLLIGVGAAALVSAAVSALHGKPGIDNPPNGGGGTETRIPLFGFHFP
jgi:hypothetical protein